METWFALVNLRPRLVFTLFHTVFTLFHLALPRCQDLCVHMRSQISDTWWQVVAPWEGIAALRNCGIAAWLPTQERLSRLRFALTITFFADAPFHINLSEAVPWALQLLPHMDGAAFMTSTIDAWT